MTDQHAGDHALAAAAASNDSTIRLATRLLACDSATAIQGHA